MSQNLNLISDNWDYQTNRPLTLNGISVYGESIVSKQIPPPYLNLQTDYSMFHPLDVVYKFPEKIFIYILTARYDKINSLISNNESPFPPEVIDIWFKCDNLRVIILNDCESDSIEILEKLDNWCKNNKLQESKLWVINNNKRLREHKDKINTRINVHSSNTVYSCGFPFNLFEPTCKINFLTKKEGLFFMCQNLKVKPHRYALLILLKKHNLLDEVDWSLVQNFNFYEKNIDEWITSIFYKSELDDLRDDLNYFLSINQKKCNYEKKYDWFDDRVNPNNIPYPLEYDKDQIENSYFNITTEAEFLSKNIHISEKSFKPFTYLQFPLILASQHHIKEIRRYYDFDFFDDIIDHSYDEIYDPRKRLMKFVKEIKRISESKDFFIDFYIKNKDRFIENQKKVVKIIYDKTDQELLYKIGNEFVL